MQEILHNAWLFSEKVMESCVSLPPQVLSQCLGLAILNTSVKGSEHA